MNACTIAGGDGILTETMAVAKKQEGLLANILQRNRTARRQHVFLRKHGKERLGEQREGFKFVATNGKSEDSDVNRAGAEAIEQDGGDFLDDGELDLRKFLRECSEDAREQIRRDGWNRSYRYGASDGIFLFDNVAASGFEFAQDSAGAWEKCFAEFGEAHGAAEAIEEPRAKFILELEDLLRKRRLGDVRLLGGARERAGVSDGAEIT